MLSVKNKCIHDVQIALTDLGDRIKKGKIVLDQLKSTPKSQEVINQAAVRYEELNLRALVATICLQCYELAVSPFATLQQRFHVLAGLYGDVFSTTSGISENDFLAFVNSKNKECDNDLKGLADIYTLYTDEVCKDQAEFDNITGIFISSFWEHYIKQRTEFTQIK